MWSALPLPPSSTLLNARPPARTIEPALWRRAREWGLDEQFRGIQVRLTNKLGGQNFHAETAKDLHACATQLVGTALALAIVYDVASAPAARKVQKTLTQRQVQQQNDKGRCDIQISDRANRECSRLLHRLEQIVLSEDQLYRHVRFASSDSGSEENQNENFVVAPTTTCCSTSPPAEIGGATGAPFRPRRRKEDTAALQKEPQVEAPNAEVENKTPAQSKHGRRKKWKRQPRKNKKQLPTVLTLRAYAEKDATSKSGKNKLNHRRLGVQNGENEKECQNSSGSAAKARAAETSTQAEEPASPVFGALEIKAEKVKVQQPQLVDVSTEVVDDETDTNSTCQDTDTRTHLLMNLDERDLESDVCFYNNSTRRDEPSSFCPPIASGRTSRRTASISSCSDAGIDSKTRMNQGRLKSSGRSSFRLSECDLNEEVASSISTATAPSTARPRSSRRRTTSTSSAETSSTERSSSSEVSVSTKRVCDSARLKAAADQQAALDLQRKEKQARAVSAQQNAAECVLFLLRILAMNSYQVVSEGFLHEQQASITRLGARPVSNRAQGSAMPLIRLNFAIEKVEGSSFYSTHDEFLSYGRSNDDSFSTTGDGQDSNYRDRIKADDSNPFTISCIGTFLTRAKLRSGLAQQVGDRNMKSLVRLASSRNLGDDKNTRSTNKGIKAPRRQYAERSRLQALAFQAECNSRFVALHLLYHMILHTTRTAPSANDPGACEDLFAHDDGAGAVETLHVATRTAIDLALTTLLSRNEKLCQWLEARSRLNEELHCRNLQLMRSSHYGRAGESASPHINAPPHHKRPRSHLQSGQTDVLTDRDRLRLVASKQLDLLLGDPNKQEKFCQRKEDHDQDQQDLLVQKLRSYLEEDLFLDRDLRTLAVERIVIEQDKQALRQVQDFLFRVRFLADVQENLNFVRRSRTATEQIMATETRKILTVQELVRNLEMDFLEAQPFLLASKACVVFPTRKNLPGVFTRLDVRGKICDFSFPEKKELFTRGQEDPRGNNVDEDRKEPNRHVARNSVARLSREGAGCSPGGDQQFGDRAVLMQRHQNMTMTNSPFFDVRSCRDSVATMRDTGAPTFCCPTPTQLCTTDDEDNDTVKDLLAGLEDDSLRHLGNQVYCAKETNCLLRRLELLLTKANSSCRSAIEQVAPTSHRRDRMVRVIPIEVQGDCLPQHNINSASPSSSAVPRPSPNKLAKFLLLELPLGLSLSDLSGILTRVLSWKGCEQAGGVVTSKQENFTPRRPSLNTEAGVEEKMQYHFSLESAQQRCRETDRSSTKSSSRKSELCTSARALFAESSGPHDVYGASTSSPPICIATASASGKRAVSFYRRYPYEIRSTPARVCVLKIWRGLLRRRRKFEKAEQQGAVGLKRTTTGGIINAIFEEGGPKAASCTHLLGTLRTSLTCCEDRARLLHFVDSVKNRAGIKNTSTTTTLSIPSSLHTHLSLFDLFGSEGCVSEHLPRTDMHWLRFGRI
ncbi:unnamed protein product [Amoebophrya sp. A120]|nr:unnamed protein product [Amoebophrya sp. A120]|eukprot:GSA120T00011098001.1